MSQNSSDWMRSITIASPVLVAALVSVVPAVTTMLNPAEATTPNEGQGQQYQHQNGQGQNGQETPPVTARQL